MDSDEAYQSAGDRTDGFVNRSIGVALGFTPSMSKPRKRLIGLLFAFCFAAIALLPIIVEHPKGLLGTSVDHYWFYGMYGFPAMILVLLRIFKVEKVLGAIFVLWLVFAIGYHPVLTGNTEYWTAFEKLAHVLREDRL